MDTGIESDLSAEAYRAGVDQARQVKPVLQTWPWGHQEVRAPTDPSLEDRAAISTSARWESVVPIAWNEGQLTRGVALSERSGQWRR